METAWLRAGGNSQHHIVLPLVMLGKMRIAISLCSPDLLIHPYTESRRAEEILLPKRSSEEFSRKGPEAREMDERFPTNSGALSDTRCVSDEGLTEEKKGPWPHATRLKSWRVSFRREVTSGSCRH